MAPPETLDLEASPGSLIPLAPAWSVAYATDLRAFCYTQSLHTFTLAGYTFLSAPHQTLVTVPSGVTLYHRLSFRALGSIRSCSVGHLQDVVSHSDYTLAPPTLDSAVGCHPCFALGLHQWAVNIIAIRVSSSSCHHPFACSSCHLFVISSKDPTFIPSFVCLFLFGVRSDLLEGTLCHKYVQLISFFIDF